MSNKSKLCSPSNQLSLTIKWSSIRIGVEGSVQTRLPFEPLMPLLLPNMEKWYRKYLPWKKDQSQFGNLAAKIKSFDKKSGVDTLHSGKSKPFIT